MGKTFVLGMILCVSLLVSGCFKQFSRNTYHRNCEPSTMAVWIDSTYNKPPIRYFSGELKRVNVIECSVEYYVKNERCYFTVTSKDDTIAFSVSEYYVGTNADSINIMICWASGKSSINIIPNCGWAMHGRCFTQGGLPMNELCNISSTKPVHVAAFVLVDWRRDNKMKTIYEYEKEVEMMRLDSIIRAIP